MGLVECAICLDVIQDAAVTECNHAFWYGCDVCNVLFELFLFCSFECVTGLLQQQERARQVG